VLPQVVSDARGGSSTAPARPADLHQERDELTTGRSRLSLLGLLLVLVLAAGCGDDGAESARTVVSEVTGDALGTIQEGKLTVCTDIPYAPFEFEEGGEVVGIDVDIVKAVARNLRLGAEFRDTDFDGIFAALRAGRCDIIASSVSITEERKQENDFSTGYFEINQSLLVRKGDAARYTDLAALRGRTVGVQSGTTGADFARANAQGATIREFTGADELFTALRSGQIDGIVQDYPVNAYNGRTTGETVITRTFTETEKEQYGLVIPKGRNRLKAAIDAALVKIRADGTYDEILKRYLGDTTGRP